MALSNEAWKGLAQLYPRADPRTDYRLEAPAGGPPVLAFWSDALGPRPTEQQIADAIAAYDAAAQQAAQAEATWRTQDQAERDALATIDAQWQTYLDTPNNSVTQNMTIVATKNLIRVARWLVKRVRAGRLGD